MWYFSQHVCWRRWQTKGGTAGKAEERYCCLARDRRLGRGQRHTGPQREIPVPWFRDVKRRQMSVGGADEVEETGVCTYAQEDWGAAIACRFISREGSRAGQRRQQSEKGAQRSGGRSTDSETRTRCQA